MFLEFHKKDSREPIFLKIDIIDGISIGENGNTIINTNRYKTFLVDESYEEVKELLAQTGLLAEPIVMPQLSAEDCQLWKEKLS